MTRFIGEIFSMLKGVSPEDQVGVLQQNDSASLRTLLLHATDPAHKYLLPEGPPARFKPIDPNRRLPIGTGDTHLLVEAKKLAYKFLPANVGGHPTLEQRKREELFLTLLTDLHPIEAEYLLAVKEQTLLTELGVTMDVLHQAFPDSFRRPKQPKPAANVASPTTTITNTGGPVTGSVTTMDPNVAVSLTKTRKAPKTTKPASVNLRKKS